MTLASYDGMSRTFVVESPSLGGAWLECQRLVIGRGEPLEDYLELRSLTFTVREPTLPDPALDRWAETEHIIEMRKVFHTGEPNRFGHSYRERMHGPRAGEPLAAVIATLRARPDSRKACLTLVGSGEGDVPCLNVIQFLARGDRLEAIYFARSQDVHNKLYADAICVLDLATEVRASLGLTALSLTGIIGSAHVYQVDLERTRAILAESAREEEGL